MKKGVSSFYQYLVLSLSFILMVSIVAFILKIAYERHYAGRLAELEQIIFDMRSSINVDSVRQYEIQKIIAILNEYNATLPHEEKYEIAETIFKMSQKYSNLNTDLICATITHETGGSWDPETSSKTGALGLMQIMPATGVFISFYEDITWTSPEEVLFNPVYNITIGCRYLSTLIDHYDIEGGLAAYSGGEKRAAKWLTSGKEGGILSRETQEYVPAIKRLYEEFQAFRM
ncbi:transglycosylase SLT domain-containing protein [candidate division KSB1 bacterium]|nr:transglycosylase SLT domain-containing protein [candidate division KSB1 bacterium]